VFVRPFDFARASSLAEASELLGSLGPGARVIAGGQSLLPMINLGIADVTAVVDIGRIPGLGGIERRGDILRVGALVTHRGLELSAEVAAAAPLLAAAAGHIGNLRVRNRGTVGGSLAHNDPAAELPLVMTVLDAGYEVAAGERSRSLPAAEFATGMFDNALGDGEILAGVSIPVAGGGWGFREFAPRRGDFALAAAAAVVELDGDRLGRVRLGLTGLGSGPVRCRTWEETAAGVGIDEIPGLADLITADLGRVAAGPEGEAYRTHLARVVGAAAVADAVASARGSRP